ncbi:hypothetical protein MMA231_01594 [Asticcacaulis sp. MM231]|uniref:hypothetical protein n=1 Tax=Asticcacaulis sp. MM231 TaxID=3157666 RepID=UPI0032D59450
MPITVSEKRLSVFFAIFLAAFFARVAIQLVQKFSSIGWLPPFERWQSGLLPYPVLLAAQIAILAGSLSFLMKIMQGKLVRHYLRGRVLRILGWLYLAFDIVRIVLGATVLRDSHFFNNPIPATFHVVLALMVLIWAGFHLRTPRPLSA